MSGPLTVDWRFIGAVVVLLGEEVFEADVSRLRIALAALAAEILTAVGGSGRGRTGAEGVRVLVTRLAGEFVVEVAAACCWARVVACCGRVLGAAEKGLVPALVPVMNS